LLAFTCAIVYPAATVAAALGATLGFVVVGAVALGAALALVVGLVVAAALGFALAFTATPLFQINLPLFFTQVNCLPAEILFTPAFLQVAPAFTEANEPGAETADKTRAKITTARDFFIRKCYGNFSPKARSTAYSQHFRS
jgi:hypothetical protein